MDSQQSCCLLHRAQLLHFFFSDSGPPYEQQHGACQPLQPPAAGKTIGNRETSMAVATIENTGKSVVSHQESFSQESSQSESTRQVGNAKIHEKSSSFQSEEAAQVVEKTGTGSVSKMTQSTFTSTKEENKPVDDDLTQVTEAMQEPKVNELIKSFEESQVPKATNTVRTEVHIALKETNGSSSKALELINKFIDVPEPVVTETVIAEPEKEIAVEPVRDVAAPVEPEKEVVEEVVKEVAVELGTDPVKETSENVDSIDIEMRELSKEIEELKKEEERCEKSFTDRQTSTSSLEEAFVRRLEERRYQNVQEMLADSLPPLFKAKRPESLPPGNLIHLLHSVQIAQELNSVLKQAKKEDRSSDSKASEDDNSGRDTRPIDLEKLFTPATDSGEVTPSRNRKMYASSSFYSPFHPTVEDQVELARRISSSLCDISNKQSKGQSMYVNRMKRSVKWVHGGDEKESQENTYTSNEESSVINYNIPPYAAEPQKNPLKLVMNPHGKVQDLNSLTQQGLIIQPPLSPELCFDLVKDLNTTKGKGAELFAKRRKKSEKWVVDENTVRQTSTSSSVQRQTSQMSAEKAMNLSNQQREQQMHKIQEIKGRLNQPKVKLVKSPWDAALETGSVDAAFQEMNPVFPEPPISWTAKISETSTKPLEPRRREVLRYGGSRSDLYLPNIPKGWTSPQFGSSLYGYSKTEKSGSSSAPTTVLPQFNTNTIQRIAPTHTKLPPTIDSTPKSVLKKPAAFNPQLESFQTTQKSSLIGKKREMALAPKEKEQKVTFFQESSDVSSKKIKTETVPERNLTAVEKELESIQTQIKSMEEEVGVEKLEQTTSKTFKEVVKSDEKQLNGDRDEQKSKPAALVIGAVPLFKGLEDIATKTNLLLHKELQSKLPGRKQKDKGKGSQSKPTPITTEHNTQISQTSYSDRENLQSGLPQVDQHRITEKSHPLPQVSVLPTQPTIDSTTAYSSQSQHYPKLWDFSSWNNYNTAPRGWKQNLDYYRPVTFTPSYKLPENAYYTDY